MSRSNMQPPKAKKQGFFGEDEESEPSMYFNNPSVFRQEKDNSLQGMMGSVSPSQLSWANHLYGQQHQAAEPAPRIMNNMALPQRGLPNPNFQRNAGTPTSIAPPNFPVGMQQQPPPQQASPNRNLFGMNQNQRGIINPMPSTQAQIGGHLKRPASSGSGSSGMLSSHTNTVTSSIIGFGRSHSDSHQPSLDMSEFPSLGNTSNNTANPSLSTARSYGMVSKPSQETTAGFQILQEDFPALPGAQNPLSAVAESARKTISPTSTSGMSSMYNNNQDFVKDASKFPGEKTGTNQPRRGIQTHADGTVSNIPSGMVTDQFGMVGLLTFIRAAETDPNLVALAPGIDLTTLGLNLNSPENLYSTFQSPWADSPCRPQDIDFHVPSEYLTNIFIRDKLAPIKLNRYTEDLLFFLYYMNGGDVLQLAAAAELYNRDWRYHKEERVWITRVPGMEPVMKTNTFERGTYYFFDAQNWRRMAKEFRLEYDKLEERPQLPPTLHHNPNQPTAVVN